MNLGFNIYLPMPEEFFDFQLDDPCEISKNIYVIQSGLLTNDNERQILEINDYLFELDFDREMRKEKPAVDLTQNIIVKKKELSLYIDMIPLK